MTLEAGHGRHPGFPCGCTKRDRAAYCSTVSQLTHLAPKIFLAASLTLPLALTPIAPAQTTDQLKVAFIDVEGGQATLFVTPQHESLLIDTGWPGNASRDADRIAAAAKAAGLQKIDFVLITHFHTDHVGGVPQLVARIPVGTFIDHGPNREVDGGITQGGFEAYQKIVADGHYKHITARPGDVLPIKGMHVTVVSGDGDVLGQPLPGAGQPNPFCAASEIRPADTTENARSLGVEITFGKLRIVDLGDLTWDKERPLVCPLNKLGVADVLIVSHHGWNQSSSPALVDALHARVAIMDNGEKKGGSTPTFGTLAKAPGLEALYQLHASAEAGPANAPEANIANPLGTEAGYPLELTATRDGSFTVLNPRTQTSIPYAAAH